MDEQISSLREEQSSEAFFESQKKIFGDAFLAQKAAENSWAAFDGDFENPAIPAHVRVCKPERILTGKGSTIAIVDHPLWLDHPGYKHALSDIRCLNGSSNFRPEYHGPAVASIAVDKTIGMAPDAKLVYLVHEPQGVYDGSNLENRMPYSLMSKDRVNFNVYTGLRYLKDFIERGNRLDAVSMSIGWGPNDPWVKKPSSKSNATARRSLW